MVVEGNKFLPAVYGGVQMVNSETGTRKLCNIHDFFNCPCLVTKYIKAGVIIWKVSYMSANELDPIRGFLS